MPAKIIRSTEPIAVNAISVLIFGQPGSRKTSMAQTAANPLTIDFDRGTHRAFGRKDSLHMESWKDVVDAGADGVFNPYSTLILDTVGRLLDLMTPAVMAQSPKNGNRMGGLSLPGWGILKSWFAAWMAGMRVSGKDVVLICHESSDKHDDLTYYRPDVQGGSYAEVIKSADIIGYSHFFNGKRVLNFNPTDTWMAKGPSSWKPFELPEFDKDPTFLARVIANAKASFGQVSADSAAVEKEVERWKEAIPSIGTEAQANDTMQDYVKAKPIVQAQIKHLLWDHCSKVVGLLYDPKKKAWTAPKQEPVGAA